MLSPKLDTALGGKADKIILHKNLYNSTYDPYTLQEAHNVNI